MINWRELYACKDLPVFEKTMYALNTTVNSMGGAMLLDFIIDSIEKKDDGTYSFDESIYETLQELRSNLYPLFNNLANIEDKIHSQIEVQEVSLLDALAVIYKSISTNSNNLKVKNNKVEVFSMPENYKQLYVNLNLEAFEECMDELITNSIKYSPADSTIWIEVVDQKNQIILKISNRSVLYTLVNEQVYGIPVKHTELVFAPFERLNRNLNEKFEEKWSLGLGLYVVKKILAKMGIKIYCQNALNYVQFQKPQPITVFCLNINKSQG